MTGGRIPAPVLQVWDATGAAVLGQLAAVESLTVSEVLSDTGSLQVVVPRSVPGAALIDTDEDRQLCLRLPGVPPMWWVVDDDTGTWISDDPGSESLTVTCRSLHAVLDEAPIGPQGGVGTPPPSWAWDTVTPGAVVADVWAAAQGRGLLQGLTLDGGATVDAAGAAWPDTVTVTHQASTTVLGVLAALRDAGLAEYRIRGRAVQIYRPAGALDQVVDVVLRPRRDVVAAPMQRSRRSVVTDVIVEGVGGDTVRRSQTLTGRRRREVWVSEQQLDTAPAGPAETAGDLYLAAHAAADVQLTHDLTDGDDSPRPWIDYGPGDRVATIAAGPQVVRRRVLQVALSMSGDGTRVSLEMGSILRTAEETMQRQIARLVTETAVS